MGISSVKRLRRIFIPLLKKLNPGKISIKHHYTGNKFVLDAFVHKGYWYYGKKREVETMERFRDFITPGSTIVEVGGHIGYISVFFSYLAGDKGRVIVFEPGNNNLPYIKENVSKLKNVMLIEKAVSDSNGTAKFYTENLSGQNNSLKPGYGKSVEKMSYVKKEETVIEVETITLDTYFANTNIKPDFIKIDIEGAEDMAINGMKGTMSTAMPMLMIEITKNRQEVFALLKRSGYALFSPTSNTPIDEVEHYGNTFCLHTVRHKDLIAKLAATAKA